MIQSKTEGKDQKAIQSSTIPDPGYQWESDNVTIRQLNESQEVSPFPAGDHKASININHPQKKHCLGMVRKIFYWRAKTGFTARQPHP